MDKRAGTGADSAVESVPGEESAQSKVEFDYRGKGQNSRQCTPNNVYQIMKKLTYLEHQNKK